MLQQTCLLTSSSLASPACAGCTHASRHAFLPMFMPCCACCGHPLQATLALLGLEHCRDTIVGDAMIR